MTAPLPPPPYRPAVHVSEDIRNHCHIYLDEQLYIIALTLLTDLVTSGASHPDCLTRPAFVPPPFHIELVSTLLVHPRYTTHVPPSERVDLGFRCITFLRSVLEILGPVNANLSEAFSLSDHTGTRASRRGRNAEDGDDGASGSDSEENQQPMRGVVANRGRIGRCAKDFWHVVGWAFNCSVSHPKRWKYWKVWLEYMLDVLDADWHERVWKDSNDDVFNSKLKEDPDTECEYKFLWKSLVVRHLSGVKGRSNAVKRVIKSAFADGSTESTRAYPEIFQGETKEPVLQKGQKRKRADELERKYGDSYDDDYEHDTFDSSQPTDTTPDMSQDTNDGGEIPTLDHWLGGPESIALRQRVLALLSRVAAVLPGAFDEVRDVYEIYYECIKPLPVPAFSLFISPSNSSHFPTEVLVSLTQLLLLRLLPNNAPRPQSISHRSNDDLSQDVLETCFLPFSANTSSIQDNAKVSLLVESVFRLFSKTCQVYQSRALHAAIEKGILSREARIKSDRRRKENGARTKEDENDKVWLIASGERLRSLLAWVEESDQKISNDD